jgi:hypothetical protein
MPNALTLARLHGAFNVAMGVWPLAHTKSFEAVFGPKADRWLMYTVAGLMSAIGATQLGSGPDPGAVRQARRIGIGCAATLAAIDLVYVPKGRIAPTYLLDALAEAGWIAAWAGSSISD